MNLRTEKENVLRFKAMKYLAECSEFCPEYNENDKIALAYQAISWAQFKPRNVTIDKIANDTLILNSPIEMGEYDIIRFVIVDNEYYVSIRVYDDNGSHCELWDI